MTRSNYTVALALLLAGCGGGGSEPTDVSATPTAPPAATPAPPVATPPTATTPIVVAPPKVPAAPDVPTVPHPTPPPEFIDSAVVSQALGTRIMGPVGAMTQAQMVGGSTMAYVAQDFHRDMYDPGTYYSWSAGDDLPKVFIDIRNGPRDYTGAWLGTRMVADSTALGNDGGFQISGQVQLDVTFASKWTASPWYAEIRLNSDTDKALFQLCWNLHLPNVDRLSCGKFDRLTAEFRGVRIVDDSQGLGALTWE